MPQFRIDSYALNSKSLHALDFFFLTFFKFQTCVFYFLVISTGSEVLFHLPLYFLSSRTTTQPSSSLVSLPIIQGRQKQSTPLSSSALPLRFPILKPAVDFTFVLSFFVPSREYGGPCDKYDWKFVSCDVECFWWWAVSCWQRFDSAQLAWLSEQQRQFWDS